MSAVGIVDQDEEYLNELKHKALTGVPADFLQQPFEFQVMAVSKLFADGEEELARNDCDAAYILFSRICILAQKADLLQRRKKLLSADKSLKLKIAVESSRKKSQNIERLLRKKHGAERRHSSVFPLDGTTTADTLPEVPRPPRRPAPPSVQLAEKTYLGSNSGSKSTNPFHGAVVPYHQCSHHSASHSTTLSLMETLVGPSRLIDPSSTKSVRRIVEEKINLERTIPFSHFRPTRPTSPSGKFETQFDTHETFTGHEAVDFARAQRPWSSSLYNARQTRSTVLIQAFPSPTRNKTTQLSTTPKRVDSARGHKHFETPTFVTQTPRVPLKYTVIPNTVLVGDRPLTRDGALWRDLSTPHAEDP